MSGSVASVRTITSIRPDDFGFSTDAELNAWLQLKMDEITVSIEVDRNRTDFTGYELIVDGIADRWGAAFVRFVMANRDSPIVRVDDFSVELPMDNIPGDGIWKDLRKQVPRVITKRVVFESGVVKAHPDDATGF